MFPSFQIQYHEELFVGLSTVSSLIHMVVVLYPFLLGIFEKSCILFLADQATATSVEVDREISLLKPRRGLLSTPLEDLPRLGKDTLSSS